VKIASGKGEKMIFKGDVREYRVQSTEYKGKGNVDE